MQRHIDEEHAALREGSAGRALYLSGQFHVEIARIADQATITEFIAQLVSRSSLVIALYWERGGPCAKAMRITRFCGRSPITMAPMQKN